MGDVSNSDLMNVLLDVKERTGAMQAHIETTATILKDHIEDDKQMLLSIQTLQLGAARQKGFLTALTSVGSLLGAGLGYLIERVTIGHH